jgi:hypothetical protein
MPQVEKAYITANSNATLTIDLHNTTRLIQRLEKAGSLNLCSLLRSSSIFTEENLYHETDYLTATRSANQLVRKLILYFETSLTRLPNQTRTISLYDLEGEIQDVMRVEVFWWMAEWCVAHERLGRYEGKTSRYEKLKGPWMTVAEGYAKGLFTPGMMRLKEIVEELVRYILGVLLWLGDEGRDESEAECSENDSGSGNGSDSESSRSNDDGLWSE